MESSVRDTLDTLPPHDAEAEGHVLGACLSDGLAIGQVAGLLTPQDFFLGAHRTVYEVMLALHERGVPTDISLVRAELEQRNAMEPIGGYPALIGWMTATPTAAYVLHYANVVADRALRRRLLSASGQIASFAYDGATGEHAAQQALAALTQAAQTASPGRVVDLGTLLERIWDKTSKATDAQAEGELTEPGLSTGLPDLDHWSGGMRPGELVLLAARPAVGKTSLAAQIAVAAARQDVRVLVFTLEMGGEEIAARVLWQQARIDGQQAVRGLLNEEGLGKLSDALGALSELPIRVDDTASLPVAALVSRARAEQAERGVGLVIVDYLQLLRGAPRRDGNRTAEVTEISQALKGLARDLHCPVLALSQLNRQVEHRSTPQPALSDLRDSGSLEQDADQVWLLWRDEPAVPEAKLAVAKNRNGPTGICGLHWNAVSTRFDGQETRHRP